MAHMARLPPSPFPFPPKRVYSGASIPMRLLRRYARAIADEFPPDKIMLVARPESSKGVGSTPATPFEDSGRAT
jgi:hypothetical protein